MNFTNPLLSKLFLPQRYAYTETGLRLTSASRHPLRQDMAIIPTISPSRTYPLTTRKAQTLDNRNGLRSNALSVIRYRASGTSGVFIML